MMPDKAQVAPIGGINQMFRILPDREVETTIPPGVDGKALAELLLAKVDVTPSVARHPGIAPGISRRPPALCRGGQALGQALRE